MRYEFKYLFPTEQYQALHSALQPFVQRDRFAMRQPQGRYTVRSIYFDTADFEMFHTKINGIAHRMKVRLRGYNQGDDSSTVFMEIKRKYEGPILKNRSNTSFGVVKRLFHGAAMDDFTDQISNPDNARRFFYQILSRNMQPVINVIYEREPFLGKTLDPDNDFRITFDLNLRSVAYPRVEALYQDENVRFAFPGYSILEVKFNNYCPAWIKPLVEDFQLRREPASKYVGCILSNTFIKPDRKGDIFAKSSLSSLMNHKIQAI